MAKTEKKCVVLPTLEVDLLRQLYKKMLRVYFVEERVKLFVKQNKCSFHASTRGHEKVQTATAMLLKPGVDWFFPYYREKALMVGLGMDLEDIFQCMLSRVGDPNSEGRNMSEHFSSKSLRVVSPTACTGTQFLAAVGMAKAIKADGRDEIVYVSSGEGATSEGEYFEALNLAACEKLPVLFMIQNNGYAISVPQSTQTGSQVDRIGRGFEMDAVRVDGTRFTEMYRTLKPRIAGLRKGKGPLLVEAMVVRLDSHSSSDDQSKYRSEKELEQVREKDPLRHTELRLLEMDVYSEKDLEGFRTEEKALVDAAADKVDALAFPDESQVMTHIYSSEPMVTEEREPRLLGEKPITMVEAINRGLREEMERNEKIVMFGEDIADPKGGVFGVTRGLTDAFPGRVYNSPLAEATIMGVAQGMAIGGYKPVVEIQFGDYSWPGFMQMRNEIPTLRWRSVGAWKCPMVVRVAVGGYIRGGPYHSQCIEALYAHTPGWHIVFPSNAIDAKGLIKTAVRSDNPVLFLEHKGLYRQVYTKGLEPDADYLIPFGKSKVVSQGTDLTVVTWGRGVPMTQQALSRMGDDAPSVEVLDLRSIVPLDLEGILDSVRRTGKALVVHEDSVFMGFGAEIVAQIAALAFEHLDAPVERVGAEDCFVPFAANLEAAVLPSVDGIVEAIRRTASY